MLGNRTRPGFPSPNSGRAVSGEVPAKEEAGEMQYRPLGKTGLKVSEISFGTYGFDNPALLS